MNSNNNTGQGGAMKKFHGFMGVRRFAVAILTGVLFVPQLAADAASFDCKKARSVVEKLICADDEPGFSAGLSRFDDEMSRAYEEVLLRADNPAAIKAAQRRWLKTRNACADAACIKREYEKRFVALHEGATQLPTTIVPSNGKTLESHLFPSEAHKLKVIQDVLRSHKLHPDEGNDSFNNEIVKEPYCNQFMQDLLAGKVTAVEPDVRALSEYDPKLKKWRRCEGKELKEIQGISDPRDFFDFMSTLGGPPYRAYHLDLDGNTANGKEDLLYHETGKGYPRTGYTWVNLDTCIIQGGASPPMYLFKNAPPNFYRLSLMAKRRDEYLMLELYPNTRDPKISNYNFGTTQLNPPPRRGCDWREPIIETTAPYPGAKEQTSEAPY